MIVGYGHMVVLIKKQLSENYRKAVYRDEFKKRKESYLKYDKGKLSILEFPDISPDKLALIKKDIRQKARRELTQKITVNVIASITVILILLYVLKNLKI